MKQESCVQILTQGQVCDILDITVAVIFTLVIMYKLRVEIILRVQLHFKGTIKEIFWRDRLTQSHKYHLAEQVMQRVPQGTMCPRFRQSMSSLCLIRIFHDHL